jgi:hypothetical protein
VPFWNDLWTRFSAVIEGKTINEQLSIDQQTALVAGCGFVAFGIRGRPLYLSGLSIWNDSECGREALGNGYV